MSQRKSSFLPLETVIKSSTRRTRQKFRVISTPLQEKNAPESRKLRRDVLLDSQLFQFGPHTRGIEYQKNGRHHWTPSLHLGLHGISKTSDMHLTVEWHFISFFTVLILFIVLTFLTCNVCLIHYLIYVPLEMHFLHFVLQFVQWQ